MALGLGKMLGFNFPENFNYPYVARSMQEFWQRWHISLSTWFRDYLYIPLGGNRKGKFATYRNLFIVFFLTGLWHGSSWNFIAWGLFHGSFLILERTGLKKLLDRLPAFIGHTYTLLAVIFGWVFFRADNLRTALRYIKTMFGFRHSDNYGALAQINIYTVFIFILAIIFSTNIRQRFSHYMNNTLLHERPALKNISLVLSYGLYVGLFLYCAMDLAQSNFNPFIYFRF